MLQAAAAQAAKSTTKSGKGTVSTNVADYKDKDLQAAFASATVSQTVTTHEPEGFQIWAGILYLNPKPFWNKSSSATMSLPHSLGLECECKEI
jgi:hypothetical protein